MRPLPDEFLMSFEGKAKQSPGSMNFLLTNVLLWSVSPMSKSVGSLGK